MTDKKKLPDRWRKENKATRAVQVAFDLDERIQKVIRREAIDRGINPPDRVREILGLKVNTKPVRLRLSISLGDDDFSTLAEHFGVDATDRVGIKQKAAERLVAYVQRKENSKQGG